MGRLNTNDNFARGQNFNNLAQKLKTNKTVQFKAEMDGLRKKYELNHPLIHSAPRSEQKNQMIRSAHNTNLPKVAKINDKHKKAWFG